MAESAPLRLLRSPLMRSTVDDKKITHIYTHTMHATTLVCTPAAACFEAQAESNLYSRATKLLTCKTGRCATRRVLKALCGRRFPRIIRVLEFLRFVLVLCRRKCCVIVRCLSSAISRCRMPYKLSCVCSNKARLE